MDTFRGAEAVSRVIAKWQEIVLACKMVSTFDPATLLKDGVTCDAFLEELSRTAERIEKDNKNLAAAAGGTGTILAYQYLVVTKALSRVTAGIKDWSLYEDPDRYFNLVLLPADCCFRGDIATAADIPGYIFRRGLARHVFALLGGLLPEISAAVDAMSTLESLPLVPESVSGVLVPTRNTANDTNLEQKDILERGPHHNNDTERVCVGCRVKNYHWGLTDCDEIRSKIRCACLLQPPALDVSPPPVRDYQTRASILLRTLLSRQVCCTEHFEVWAARVSTIKRTFDKACLVC